MSEPFKIEKITQNYDATEDRVSLNVQNASGEVVVLWLTQRLANRLATFLIGWLNEDFAASDRGNPTSDLQAWEQQAAQAQLKADEQPVARHTARGEYLLKKVDLARNSRHFTLNFVWENGSAKLSLTAIQLRQWLGILYKLFDKAEWPKANWPNWFAGDPASTSVRNQRALH